MGAAGNVRGLARDIFDPGATALEKAGLGSAARYAQSISDPLQLFGDPSLPPPTTVEDFIAQRTPQALSLLRGGAEQAIDLTGQAAIEAEEALQPFGGTTAFDETAALLGGQGVEAQQASIQGIPVSEAQMFQEQQEQESLRRQAAARGELGGGATLAGAIDLGGQQVQRRISDRLGALAPIADVERGVAGTVSSMREAQAQRTAQIRAALGPQASSIRLGVAPTQVEAQSAAAELSALRRAGQISTVGQIGTQAAQLYGALSANRQPAQPQGITTQASLTGQSTSPIQLQPGQAIG